MMFRKFGLAALSVLVMTATQVSAVTVTIEDPGVTSANPGAFGAGALATERFDDIRPGGFSNFHSILGIYSAGRVDPTNQYGGADGTQYLFSQSSPGTLLTLTRPARYFGLWWSAGSVGNRVDLLSGGTPFFSFNTDDVLAFLSNGVADANAYFGNPTPRFRGWVRHEPFVFINLFSDTEFDAVRFAGRNFESDNHTVSSAFAQQTGTSISPVPVPPAFPLLLAGVGALAWVRRRAAR